MRARMAAHMLHAKRDSHEIAAKARAGFDARFEREADPDGVLPEPERIRRAEHLRKAYFLRLSLASARARRNGKASA